jgi:Druantia protein DruA/DDE_Tnp_1-associated
MLLDALAVRLVEDSERERFDEELVTKHYLRNATVVGRVLRYVAEYRGQWVALLIFSSPAFHIKLRDRWLHWSPHQVKERRHLIAQNARFLVLAAPGQWPNLASRVLKLACERLPQDWRAHFGYPVQVVETFVDPQRFRGTCYNAAGWQRLGPTQGFERDWQDFYTDTQHPKELWVRPLGARALEQVRAPELPPALADPEGPRPPACPVPTARLGSLWECFRKLITDPRKPRGVRHKLAGFLTLIALAVAAGCKGPHAIAEFAKSLNHAQRGRLRCRPRPGRPRQYDVPAERTFRRLLKKVDPEQLKDVLAGWMQPEDPAALQVVHADGKVVKNAQPAPPRSQAQQLASASTQPCEIPPELQKPKADQALTLVNFQTTEQRLVDQVAVPQDTNEEAAVAAHLPQMDLAGVCFTADAAHTTKANCRQLTQGNGAEFLLFLKANQPLALAKAQQLLPGNFPPASQHAEQGPRTD